MSAGPAERPAVRKAPLVVGHRGNAGLAPENTLASFERALADGADWVEFDVRFTRDGEPVVVHDARVDRTTDGTGPVHRHDLATLRRLDAGGWFAPAFRCERIPTLGEVLERLAGRAGANVEVKDAGESAETGVRRILEEIRRAGCTEWLLSSFQSGVVAEAARQGAPAGLLVRRGAARPAAAACRLGAGALILSVAQAGPRQLRSAHRRALQSWIYTVNDAEGFARAAEWGFDAIIGDRPDLLRAWRERL